MLRAVPGSRLRLRHFALTVPEMRDRIMGDLSTLGIEPARLSIEPPTDGARATLPAYHAADISLDTFPYNGTTTICESLLMGVPVVTLSGDTSASRAARSILTAAGFPQWCADTEDDYVRLAKDLAANQPDRHDVHNRFLRSPVCDGPAYATRLGNAITNHLQTT